ncbi:MAG: hypothetical protein JSV42_13910, partial [Chloroflexota bacterium]
KLLTEDGGSRIDLIMNEAGAIFQALIRLPRQLESVLAKVERDEIGIRAPTLERGLANLELSLRRIVYALIFIPLVVAGVQLQIGGELLYAGLFYLGAIMVLVGLVLARPKRH